MRFTLESIIFQRYKIIRVIFYPLSLGGPLDESGGKVVDVYIFSVLFLFDSPHFSCSCNKKGKKQNIQKYDFKLTTLSSLSHNKRTTESAGIIQIGKRLQLLTRAHEVDVTLFGNGINKKSSKTI